MVQKVHASFSDYEVWLSENNADDAEVGHFVLDDISSPWHACPYFEGPSLHFTRINSTVWFFFSSGIALAEQRVAIIL